MRNNPKIYLEPDSDPNLQEIEDNREDVENNSDNESGFEVCINENLQ